MKFGTYNAPVAIVVCGNMKLARGGFENYWVQDCSVSIENILIAASGLELGGVWIGVYPDEYKEPRTQYNEKRVYWQRYDSNRKHRARPKNLKKL